MHIKYIKYVLYICSERNIGSVSGETAGAGFLNVQPEEQGRFFHLPTNSA
ncbi:hypothetical protein J21TS3_38850 [Paenibacillus cookii]|uniref:Uncharacterized protein n=1 Tax=Paenibacillus cookii TaxID=157839 RepID=A0ABQ4M0P3_9BACL|nr:hypothetical protein J21TS3_38850 [Paenibacillus cookii]